MRSVLGELKRRNVYRAAAFYAASAWLLVQIATQVFPFFDLPNWSVRLIVVAAIVGFPFALLFSWFYEITPDGLKLEREVDRRQSITHHTGKRLDRWIIATLGLAVVLLLADKFVLHGDTDKIVAAPVPEQSIAVLPFVDMSVDKDQEYMSDGLAEELLNLLAKIPALHVTSRTSAFSFKGTNIGIGDIAQRLHVAHVLEGSVRKSGSRLRVTAQLIDARTDTHLWSETYDRTLEDIFAVQDEIAAAVVAQLKVRLLATPRSRATDPRAYALYLQARQLARQGTASSLEQSIAVHRQALAIDPAYAAAWVGLAGSYLSQANKGLQPIDGSYTLARAAIDKALAIDADFAPAYRSLSRIASDYDGDLATAARHIEHALALEPTSVESLGEAAALADSLGRPELGLKLNEYAIAHDPLVASHHGALAYELGRLGRLDEAIESYRTALRLSPGRVGTQYNIGEVLLRKHDAAAALASMQQEPDENWRLMGLTMALHALAKRAESDAALVELIGKHGKESAYNIAYVLAFRGEADRSFEWLDKAVAYHDTGLVEISDDPMFANIHDDPRWLPFLRKVGKAAEQLAAIKLDVSLPAGEIARGAAAAAPAP